jgi:hypothetical protein
MNGPFYPPQPSATVTMPAELEVLTPPLLLPGESLEHYQGLREAIFADIAPRSAIEWLLAIDVVELSWEIRRYRIMIHKILQAYRQKAIEAALRRIDTVGIAPEYVDLAEHHTLQNALSWRLDPVAATEIEARLAAYDLDQHSINAQVYVEARESLCLFEDLLRAAQLRRIILIKEIKNQRMLDLRRVKG